MPPPTDIPITDPVVLARARRFAPVLLVFAVLVWGSVWIVYLSHIEMSRRSLVSVFLSALGWPLCLWWRRRVLTLPRFTREILPHPLSLVEPLTIAVWVACAFALLVAHPLFPRVAYVGLVALPVTAIGLVLILHARFGREPGPPACLACAYPVTGLSFPTACPECAHALPDARSAITTRVVRRAGLAWAGAALLALTGVTLAGLFLRPVLAYRSLPHAALVRMGATDAHALAEFAGRNLTPREHALLSDAILDARRDRELWEIDAQASWIAAELAAGRLTPEQADRFASEGFTTRIITRGQPRVGRTLEVSIAGTPPEHNASAVMLGYFFAGFETGNQPAVGRLDDIQDSVTLSHTWESRDRGRQWSLERGFNPTTYPTLFLKPDHPGDLTIRARIIAITYATGAAAAFPRITWRDDGSYTITPQPLTAHELTAETTITVAP